MNQHERPAAGQILWTNEEIAEFSLLLPGWQAAELESLAGGQGLTLGQLLRRVIGEYLARQSDLGLGASPLGEFALMTCRCPDAVFGAAEASSTGMQNGSSKVPTTKEEGNEGRQ